MAPTSTGRTIAGLCGLLLGFGTTYYMTKDIQLVKFEPATPNADGSLPPRKVKVSFKEMQPLELTEEAKRRKRAKQDQE